MDTATSTGSDTAVDIDVDPDDSRFYALIPRIQALAGSGWKSATANLVKMLHDPVTGPLVLRHFTEGMDYVYPNGHRVHVSFARLCFMHGRADVVRAIVEGGTPTWLRDLPAAKRRRTLPRESTPNAWFEALWCYKPSVDDNTFYHSSAYRSVCSPVGCHTAAFIALALEFQPDHGDIAGLAEYCPEGAAILTQLQMDRVIAAAPAPADQAPAVPRLRSRVV